MPQLKKSGNISPLQPHASKGTQATPPTNNQYPSNTKTQKPKIQELNSGKVLFSKFDDQKYLARFERIRSQIHERKEFIARNGSVVAGWRTYRAIRLGPYYRVAFRQNHALQSIYIGRNERLVTMVRALIEELKQSRSQDRLIRRLRCAARRALRRSLAELEVHVAPLGYRRRGFRLCKQRETTPIKPQNAPTGPVPVER